MVSALDSEIFAPLFGDEEVDRLFDDDVYLHTMLAVEGALARAEARLGVIASEVAERISKTAATAARRPS